MWSNCDEYQIPLFYNFPKFDHSRMDQSVSQDFRLKNLDLMWAQVESKYMYAYMLETSLK